MRNFPRFLSMLVLLACALIPLTAQDAKAASKGQYPSKPIEVVTPWAAGGGSDIFLRTLATGAQKYMGQPWVIINREGAGGVVGTSEFLTAKNDGYRVLFQTTGPLVTQPKLNKVPYTAESFEPVIGTTVDPILLFTNKQSGVKSVDDLKKYIKDNKLNFGFTGKGSLFHVGFSGVFNDLGAKVNGVTYGGGGELMAALLGNHIQFAAAHPVNVMGHKDSKEFVPLMVLSENRIKEYPDVPTAKELGLNHVFEVWKLFMVPKGTDPKIKETLYNGIQAMLNDPEIRANLEKGGSTFMEKNDPATITERLRKDVKNAGKVLDDLGLSVKN